MKPMTHLALLGPLKNKTVFTAQEARRLGVRPSLLAYYVKKGFLKRLQRGIYRNPASKAEPDFRWEDLIVTILTIPKGVVCLLSALAIYELTDEIPREQWIAVPNSMTAPRRKNIRSIRMRNMTIGKTTIKLGDVEIPIFDKERTVVDAFRYLGKETAIRALKALFSSGKKHKPEIKKLKAYAGKLRVPIDPYLLMVTT